MTEAQGTGTARSNVHVEGVAAVEIKITVKPEQELQGLRALKLDEDKAEARQVFFYDTADLALFDAGIVLRARLVKDGADDSTVKVRPVEPRRIQKPWPGLEGFKLEADCIGEKVVCSASLTVRQKRDEIDDVAKGKRAIEKLFSKEQTRFVEELHGAVDFAGLRPLGPIRVLRWKTERKGLSHELTAEEWRLPDGEDMLELSIKVPPRDADSARRDFEEFLRAQNLDPAGAQVAKTRTALEYFARGGTSTR